MTTLREAAQQALEALDSDENGAKRRAVRVLCAALAEPQEQEPVGWFESPHGDFRANPLYKMEFPSSLLKWQIPLFIAPPQRPTEPEERNFCPRCGKRTKDIHTCTPPHKEPR